MAAVALLCLDLVLTVSIFNARLLTPLQAGADCQVQCDSWRDGVHIAGSVLALVVVAAHRALRLCALGGTRISGSAAVAVLVVLAVLVLLFSWCARGVLVLVVCACCTRARGVHVLCSWCCASGTVLVVL